MRLPSLRAGLALVLALSVPPTLLSSCSDAEQHEAAADTQEAYDSFKTYVEAIERKARSVDFTDTEFSAEMTRVTADYDAKLAIADREADRFSAEQRASLESLKARYATAFAQREAAFKAHKADTITTSTTTTADSSSEDATDSLRSGAYRAGQAIGRGASAAGEAIDRGAQKVGTAAKEAYKGARDAVKNPDRHP